jgi:membrane protein required for colicin V production
MPVTWLDLLLLAIMLVSGILAMIRGFMREVLSVAAWAGAAVATVLLYDKLLPVAEANLGAGTIAKVAVILGVFILTLIIGSLITARISDLVLDSRIGALDRSLGFVYGLARGLLIVVVAFHLFIWFVPEGKRPEGVRDAKSNQLLQSTGQWVQSLLPQDMDNYLSTLFSTVFKKPKGGDQDPPDAAPNRRPDKSGRLNPADPRSEQVGYARSDRSDMRQLIEGRTR